MQKKSIAIYLLRNFVILLLGMMIGVVATHFYEKKEAFKESEEWRRTVKKNSDNWEFAVSRLRIIERVRALETLRRGEAKLLINTTDYDLSLELHAFQFSFPVEQWCKDTNTVKTLKAAAQYRTKYPYKTGEEWIDTPVENFLAMILTNEIPNEFAR